MHFGANAIQQRRENEEPRHGCWLTDLPDRRSGETPVQSRLQKYISSLFSQIKSITRAVSSHQGALAIVTNAGRDAVDADVLLTNSTGCGRRSRVVLTPRCWRQVGGKYPAGDGDNKARSPGRARRKPLKPLRAGMPGETGEPRGDDTRVVLFFPTRGCGCIEHPAFPTPLFSIGRNDQFITRT